MELADSELFIAACMPYLLFPAIIVRIDLDIPLPPFLIDLVSHHFDLALISPSHPTTPITQIPSCLPTRPSQDSQIHAHRRIRRGQDRPSSHHGRLCPALRSARRQATPQDAREGGEAEVDTGEGDCDHEVDRSSECDQSFGRS